MDRRRGARIRPRDHRDRPFQRRAGLVRAGAGGRRRRGPGAGRASSTRAATYRPGRPRCTASRPSGRATRACPWRGGQLLADAVVSAGRRGVPLAGMKLDYDLTMVETQAVQLCGRGIVREGMVRTRARRRCDRPSLRPGAQGPANARRSVRSLRHRDRACTRRVQSMRSRPWRCSSPWPRGTTRCGSAISSDSTRTRSSWHREWAQEYDGWRRLAGHDPDRPPRLRVAPRPGGPVAGGLIPLQTLRRSQTMSTPSSPARTTLAGCCLSMWPTRPL